MEGKFTFIVDEDSARKHQMNQRLVQDIGDGRFLVTIPVDVNSEEQLAFYIEIKEGRRANFYTYDERVKTRSNEVHDFWVRTETDAKGKMTKIYNIIPKGCEFNGAGYLNPSQLLAVKGYSPAAVNAYFSEK